MNFEPLLSRLALAAAIVAGLFLLARLAERRRRPSVFASPAFRSAHVQPTQKASPTVATLLELKTDGADHSADHARQERHQRTMLDGMTVAEYERASNHRMF